MLNHFNAAIAAGIHHQDNLVEIFLMVSFYQMFVNDDDDNDEDESKFDDDDEFALSISSSLSSSQNSNENSDEDDDSSTSSSISFLSVSSSSDDDSDDGNELEEQYELFLISMSLGLDKGLDMVHSLCIGLINHAAVHESTILLHAKLPPPPKKNRVIAELDRNEAREQTCFTRDQLQVMREQFFVSFGGDESIVIREHRFTFDEILIIFLYHNAKAANYSDMSLWLGGDFCVYS